MFERQCVVAISPVEVADRVGVLGLDRAGIVRFGSGEARRLLGDGFIGESVDHRLLLDVGGARTRKPMQCFSGCGVGSARGWALGNDEAPARVQVTWYAATRGRSPMGDAGRAPQNELWKRQARVYWQANRHLQHSHDQLEQFLAETARELGACAGLLESVLTAQSSSWTDAQAGALVEALHTLQQTRRLTHRLVVAERAEVPTEPVDAETLCVGVIHRLALGRRVKVLVHGSAPRIGRTAGFRSVMESLLEPLVLVSGDERADIVLMTVGTACVLDITVSHALVARARWKSAQIVAERAVRFAGGWFEMRDSGRHGVTVRLMWPDA